MGNMKYLYKDAFAVIGKAGAGAANNIQAWIPPLWASANENFSEIADQIRKTENGAPYAVWGVMNDVNGSNKRWGESGQYLAGCEADIEVPSPAAWTRWLIPAQTYLVVKCNGDEYGEQLEKITSDIKNQIVGSIHERYPEAGNPSIVELYFPIASGKLFCQVCTMPMTQPEDFGTEEMGRASRDYCHCCYENGALRQDISIDQLVADVQKLIDIEAAHPNLLSKPLLASVKKWLNLERIEKTISIPALYTDLVEGQDCDFTGTQWEKSWLADGKVCHCYACMAARQCISDIKLMKKEL